MNIGEFIKQKRIEADMTQHELYLIIPTERARDNSKHGGRSAVSRIESGKQDINFQQLTAIANGFGQTVGEFATEFEKKMEDVK